MSTTTSPPVERLLDGEYDGPVSVRGPLRRLLLWLAPAYMAIFAVWGAVPGILLALQVEHIDPVNKVGNLALVTTLGAIFSMIAQPIAGLVSDRTRSRLGRRAPWMLVGSALGGALLVVLGFQSTVAGVAIGWIAVSVAYNFAQASLGAIMPDRIPRLARGSFSAVSGLGTLIGLLGGQFFGASMSGSIPVAYLVLALLGFTMFLLLALFNRDRPSVQMKREPFSFAVFVSTFWVDPRRHPDFFWAFTGRLLLNLAYYVVAGGYLLYVLADHIGLGTAAATATVPLLALASAPGAVVATTFSGPLSDRLRRRKVFIVTSGLVFAAAVSIPLFSPTVEGMILTFALGGLGYGVFQSIDAVLMSEVLPSASSFGKDLGIVNIAITLPQSLAPALAGAIVLTAGYAWLFPIAIVLSVFGALAVIPIRSVR
ncbi:MFS transporter [Microbacterium sp.]|uniref:MFS transporter n=1 Tax=Microbacterium sp. TaxID=51671 RepID=UPI00281229E7|nr:MFS transporter [Microbacterium sp.]